MAMERETKMVTSPQPQPSASAAGQAGRQAGRQQAADFQPQSESARPGSRQPAAAARRQPAACLPQHCSLRLLVAATVPILPQHRRHARLRGLAPDCGPGQPACVPPCIWYVRGPYSVSPRYLASSRDDQPFDSITAHAAGCARLPRCRHRQIRPSSERTRALPYKSTRC
jgi:hypothetical protein